MIRPGIAVWVYAGEFDDTKSSKWSVDTQQRLPSALEVTELTKLRFPKRNGGEAEGREWYTLKGRNRDANRNERLLNLRLLEELDRRIKARGADPDLDLRRAVAKEMDLEIVEARQQQGQKRRLPREEFSNYHKQYEKKQC